MPKHRKRYYFIPLFVILAMAILVGIVMLLWNGILTQVLPVKTISYGQAAGIFILCKVLFTSFRPGPPGGFRRGGPPWRHKLMDLTPEEKEQFKKEWQQRQAAQNNESPDTSAS